MPSFIKLYSVSPTFWVRSNRGWMIHQLQGQTKAQRQGDFKDNFNIDLTHLRVIVSSLSSFNSCLFLWALKWRCQCP
jgi:hypothetical protein